MKPVDLRSQYGFGNINSFAEGIQRFIIPVFEISAVIVTIYFIMASFKLITSSGEKEALSKAQAMITHSVIGYLFLIFLFLILQFLPEALGINFSLFK